MAAVVRTEKELRRMIKNAGIVRRKNDGHGPGVAVFLDGSVFAVGIERPLLNVLYLIGAAVEGVDMRKIQVLLKSWTELGWGTDGDSSLSPTTVPNARTTTDS